MALAGIVGAQSACGLGVARRAVDTAATRQRGELRAQCARVDDVGVQLRQILAVRLLESPVCALDAGASDLELLALAGGDADRLVERQGARAGVGCCAAGERGDKRHDREQEVQRAAGRVASLFGSTRHSLRWGVQWK